MALGATIGTCLDIAVGALSGALNIDLGINLGTYGSSSWQSERAAANTVQHGGSEPPPIHINFAPLTFLNNLAQTITSSNNTQYVSTTGGGNPYGEGVNYLPPGANVGSSWHAAEIGFANQGACASFGAGMMQAGGQALAVVPGWELEGVSIYVAGLSMSMALDMQAHSNQEIGDGEFVIRSGLNVAVAIPNPITPYPAMGVTGFDGLSCAVSAYYVGNYN